MATKWEFSHASLLFSERDDSFLFVSFLYSSARFPRRKRFLALKVCRKLKQ